MTSGTVCSTNSSSDAKPRKPSISCWSLSEEPMCRDANSPVVFPFICLKNPSICGYQQRRYSLRRHRRSVGQADFMERPEEAVLVEAVAHMSVVGEFADLIHNAVLP